MHGIVYNFYSISASAHIPQEHMLIRKAPKFLFSYNFSVLFMFSLLYLFSWHNLFVYQLDHLHIVFLFLFPFFFVGYLYSIAILGAHAKM